MIERNDTLRQMENTRYSTLRDWVAIGFRRRRLIVISFCGLLFGTILFASFWAARYYESEMQIFVSQDRTDPQVSSAPNAAIQSTEMVTPDQMNSEMALLRSSDILRQVVVNCGLDKKTSLTDFMLPSDSERRRAIKVEKQAARLFSKLKVEVLKQADVIDVSYGQTGAPEIPACVLRNLSALYLEKHVETHRPSGSSTDVFASEAEKYHAAVMADEEQLKAFGPREGAVAPDVERGLVATQLVNTEGLLNAAKEAAQADQRRIQEVQSQLDSMPARRETTDVDQDAGMLLQTLDTQLLAAQMKRSQLAMKYNADYPLVKEADEEVAQAQAAIADAKRNHILTHTTDQDTTYELLRQDMAKTKADLATQQASGAALTHSIHDLQMQTIALDQKAIRLADLLRSAKLNEDNYLLYSAKREQERISDAMDRNHVANVAISEPPVLPVVPAHSPFSVFLIGLAFSVFASLGAAFLVEYFDPSFHTPAEVNGVLQIPVFASIPKQAA